MAAKKFEISEARIKYQRRSIRWERLRKEDYSLRARFVSTSLNNGKHKVDNGSRAGIHICTS